MREGGVITILSRKLFVTQYQKMSLGNTSVYQKILDIETFYASEREIGGGGISRFSVENFLSHSSDKIRRRTLLCFERFLVSNF